MPAAGSKTGALPGSDFRITGSPRCGAFLTPLANLEPNSPKVRNCARSRIRPKEATSQNAVDPPLPSTTS